MNLYSGKESRNGTDMIDLLAVNCLCKYDRFWVVSREVDAITKGMNIGDVINNYYVEKLGLFSLLIRY